MSEMEHTTFEEMAEKFKAKAIRNLQRRRNEFMEHGVPEQLIDKAMLNAEDHWAEHWEPGGEFYVPEMILEGYSEYDQFGTRKGVATISPLDSILVYPQAIKSIMESAEKFVDQPDVVVQTKLQLAAAMVHNLIESRGQFVVWRMSQNINALSTNCWVVMYGDICGLAESETPNDEIMRVRSEGVGPKSVAMQPGFLHWDLLKPFVEHGLVIPLTTFIPQKG